MSKGGYWQVVPDADSEEMLLKLAAAIGIDLDSDDVPDLHVTLAYDNRNPEVEAQVNPDADFTAIVKGATLFGEGDKKILVILLESDDLQQEHVRIHACGAANFDFKPYQPHVTLLYGAKDSQAEYLNQIISHPGRPPIGLRFINESQEPIDDKAR